MKSFFNVFLCIFLLFGSVPASQASRDSLALTMTDHLECYPVDLISFDRQSPSITRQDVCLAAIYHEMGALPLWVSEDGPSEKAEIVLRYLKNAEMEGLDPQDYQVDKLTEIWHSRSYESLAILDTLLTYNVVKYIHDVSHGQLAPFMADPELFAEAGDRQFDPVVTIEKVFAVEDLDLYFASLPPDNDHYRGLKKGLALYRDIGLHQDWQFIPWEGNIFPGDSDRRIEEIRRKLSLLHGQDYRPENGDIHRYDPELEKAILSYQYYQGLKPDGIIGRNTLRELNISPERRIDQIRINMARWRWQDHDLGKDYVLVNIANFNLEAYQDRQLQLSLPVIVGKRQHQTPVFSDSIKYIEFNPFWNVPPSIAVNEELFELRKNPSYLAEKNIRLFSSWQEGAVELNSEVIDWRTITKAQMRRYKLRQDPGPFNALGRIKFVFPNHYSVYIHDTPAKSLFSEHRRSFSHGCIRVAAPEKFAEFVLQSADTVWDEEKIKTIIENGVRRVVRLSSPLPIHITYQTAWLDKNDRIHFNRDVYGRDEKLYKALLSK